MRRVAAIVVSLLALLLLAPLVLSWVSLSSATVSDVEEIGVNRLGAATLAIDVGADEALFAARDLAPGDTVRAQMDLSNGGSLPLRYAVSITTTGGPLAGWMQLDVWAAPDCSADVAADELLVENLLLSQSRVEVLGSARTGSQPGDRLLDPAEAEALCFEASLPLAAPNDVQGETLEFAIVVDAEHRVDTP